MSDSTYLKCSCSQCGGHIEFPSEALGTDANCPHCGNAIRLEVAPASTTAPTTPPPPAPPSAQPQKATVITPAPAASREKRQPRGPRAGSALDISYPELESRKSPEPPTKPRNWVRIIGLIILVVLIPVAIVSWLPKKLIQTTKQGGKDTLEMTGPPIWQKSKDGDLIFIQGTVMNFSDKPYFSVRVDFDLLNQNGTPVGTATAYVPVVDPHKTWFYKALVTDPDAKTFKLNSLKWER